VNLTFLENFSNNYSQKGLPTAAGRRKELTPWRLCGLPAAGRLCVNLVFWEMNEAHLAKNQIEKWFKKYTFK
jgi:hypothetical protein